jgi:hypothetical protein
LTETLTRSREWLLLNAVEAWLHHYENAGTPTVAQYKELQQEFHDAYMQTLHSEPASCLKDVEEPTPPLSTSTRKRTKNASQSSNA